MWILLAVVGLTAMAEGFVIGRCSLNPIVRLGKVAEQRSINSIQASIVLKSHASAVVLQQDAGLSDPRDLPLLVEEPSKVEAGTVVEYMHNSEVRIGRTQHVYEKKNTLSLAVQDMETVTIPYTQVISIWDGADEDGIAQWGAVREQAEALLNATGSRKKDLQEFWEIVSQQRSSRLAVDSVDVGVYLFQEGRFRAWLNPFTPDEAAKVRPLTLAQRYAAALLLHRDEGAHFKRRPSAVAASVPEDGDGQSALALVEGGYLPLAESVVLFKQSCLFEQYYTERVCDAAQLAARAGAGAGAASPQSEARAEVLQAIMLRQAAMDKAAPPLAIARILRQLELYALCDNPRSSNVRRGGPRGKPPATVDATIANVIGRVNAPKVVRAVLRRLNMPVTPFSARRLLVNQRSTAGYIIDWRGPVGEQGVEGVEGKSGVPPLMQVPIRSIGAGEAQNAGSRASEGAKAQADAAMAGEACSRQEGDVTAHHAAQNSLTAWGPAVIEASQKLTKLVERDNRRYAKTEPGRPGKRGPSGRMDYRAVAEGHPPICVDARHASFLDDCFSISPETGELLVHVVDVAGKLRQFEALQEVCRERVSSLFLPAGPLHMLPPAALNALTLSAESGAANEVLTVALSVHPETGELRSFRVFPSLLGPVYPLDMRTADEILSSGTDPDPEAGAEISEGGIDGVKIVNTGSDKGRRAATGRAKSFRFPHTSFDNAVEADEVVVGHPTAVVRDLRAVHRLVRKMCTRDPTLRAAQRLLGDRQSSGAAHSHRLVDALLRLYSRAATEFCTDAAANGRMAVPVVWENRDREDGSKVRRFATRPLRNWVSQLQQRQVRAALRMEPALTRKECAMAVLHHNFKRKQQSAFAGRKALLNLDYD